MTTFTPCPTDHFDRSSQPDGFDDWNAWTDRMYETHRLVPCPDCGIFMVWVPR